MQACLSRGLFIKRLIYQGQFMLYARNKSAKTTVTQDPSVQERLKTAENKRHSVLNSVSSRAHKRNPENNNRASPRAKQRR